LSLEQGQTDKLCELSERELLKLVFEVFGDEEVLMRYQEARHHQEQTTRELQDTENNLKAQENHLQSYETRVNRFLEWQRLNQERNTLMSETKPRLDFYLLSDETERAGRALEAGQRERQLKIEERSAKQTEQQRMLTAIENLTIQKQATEISEKEINDQLQVMRKAEGRLELLLEQYESLKKQSVNSGAKVGVADNLQKLEQQQAEVKSTLYGLLQQEKQLQETLENLANGKRADPFDVANFRQALDKAGIAHDLLTDLVEITDTSWQSAVEAVLASSAHIVLLADKKDEARALSLGEQLKYRHYIVPEHAPPPLAPKGSLLEIVKFSRDVPEWVFRVLAGITRVEDAKAGASLPRNEDWVTRQGYLRERRGGRFAAPDQPRFGRARLEALRDELEKIKRNIEPLQTQMRTIGSDIQQIKDLLAGVDATTQLAARAAEFAEAKTQYDTLLPARRALGEKSHEAMKTKLALEKNC